MKYLKSWLQDYIEEPLPADAVIVETLNKKAFEVEEVTTKDGDTIFDIKVLPNRAHDALGHKGMAYELCADLNLTRKDGVYKIDSDKKVPSVKVEIDDAKACTRFMSVRIDNVKVGKSPKFIKERLEAIGQRSINNIVDITNYVQFSLNKPMHAYDARSIDGILRTRFAQKDEMLTTLDDQELKLNTKTLVIADDKKTLGLAGIKGGKYSGIADDTTSVILESANFAPGMIRKTAEKYGYKTDASKRFENGIANALVEDGLIMTASLIKEHCGTKTKTKISEVTDVYPKSDMPYHVGISSSEVNAILGSTYSDKEIEGTLATLNFTWTKVIPEEVIITLANHAVGAPYHLGSSVRYDAPTTFDCSSFTSWLYVHSGVGIPRMSIDQYVFSKRIEAGDLQVGDLIFANNDIDKVYTSSIEFLPGTAVPSGINHVGIYIGGGNVAHATSMYGKVVIENLGTSPRFVHTVGYGRVVENPKEERYVVTIPSERLDIRIKEDLAEEIGRIIGFDKISPSLPKITRTGLPHKRMFYENKIKNILIAHGYSEIYTYTFGNVGEVKLVKGLASDKEKLRTNLGAGVVNALTMNLHNAPLLATDTMRVFEFGNVFTKDAETRHLSLAIDDGRKKSLFSEEVDFVLAAIKKAIGAQMIHCDMVSPKPYCIEINFDELIESLPEPTTYESIAPTTTFSHYTPISTYPFIARDIAMWVPTSTTWESVNDFLVQKLNPLIVRVYLFDTFTKKGEDGVEKKSIAFRMVYQSYEKTLTDEEVNAIHDEITKKLIKKGYEIR
jgi:phenylalanyl-tRNA synthetase beta subunit